MTPGERSCLGQVVYPGHQFRACLDATLDAMPGPSKFPKAPSKQAIQTCPSGLFGWCPGESACARQVHPTAGEQNRTPGDAAWPRQLSQVRSKQTPPGCLAAAAWVRLSSKQALNGRVNKTSPFWYSDLR